MPDDKPDTDLKKYLPNAAALEATRYGQVHYKSNVDPRDVAKLRALSTNPYLPRVETDKPATSIRESSRRLWPLVVAVALAAALLGVLLVVTRAATPTQGVVTAVTRTASATTVATAAPVPTPTEVVVVTVSTVTTTTVTRPVAPKPAAKPSANPADPRMMVQ